MKVALAQMSCSSNPPENVAAARRTVERAARAGATLCVLPEMFTNHYVGQFDDSKGSGAPFPDHRALIEDFRNLARRLSLNLVLPFAEVLGGDEVYNSLVVVDGQGEIRGHYRKVHIPNGEGYREDLYFSPGDKGYVVVDLPGLKLGVAICWDQWFPEVSRTLALRGAQLIVYPSAIGSEVAVPDYDSRPEWELVIRAQAIMNRIFIAAVNRVGQEERVRFYGGSFVADPWGKVVGRASTVRPRLLTVDIDLDQIAKANSFFGFFDTRRPDTYGYLIKEGLPQGAHNPEGG